MQSFPPTVIIRHRRENLKKCSLRGLEDKKDFLFFSYPNPKLPQLENYFILSFDGPLLSAKDFQKGILLVDATWRYADTMIQQIPQLQHMEKRSLPTGFATAYPRRQEDCLYPQRGLASVEALYITQRILGRDTSHLLDHYYWKEDFLDINAENFLIF